MLRLFLQKLLRKPVMKLAEKVSSSPRREDVFASLSKLHEGIAAGKGDGAVLQCGIDEARFIILSDQHKGCRDLADDFRLAENNYLTALKFYYDEGYTFINLGDSEELWENKPKDVIDKNREVLFQEAVFHQHNRYYRVFGNHDLEWKYQIQQNLFLKPIFGDALKVYEGIVIKIQHNGNDYCIFMTHGHQGDKRSDGNPFSTWVVAAIWTPIQRFLEVTINTTADSFELVDKHNILMYEWSATKKNMVFISGHTHKPVFASLDHIDRITKQLERAKANGDTVNAANWENELEKRKVEYTGKKLVKTMAHPSYFNSGCCCFSDGDISGIEISGGFIRLVKWEQDESGSRRKVLEESPLSYLFEQL